MWLVNLQLGVIAIFNCRVHNSLGAGIGGCDELNVFCFNNQQNPALYDHFFKIHSFPSGVNVE